MVRTTCISWFRRNHWLIWNCLLIFTTYLSRIVQAFQWEIVPERTKYLDMTYTCTLNTLIWKSLHIRMIWDELNKIYKFLVSWSSFCITNVQQIGRLQHDRVVVYVGHLLRSSLLAVTYTNCLTWISQIHPREYITLSGA